MFRMSLQLKNFTLVYTKLTSAKAAQLPTGFPAVDQLSCNNHLFFEGLHPLSDNIGTYYDRVLSIEGNIFNECTMTWPLVKKVILSGL